MSGKKKAFALRLSPELYTVLERWAADELRSVNGQIEFVLTDAARRAGRAPRAAPDVVQHESKVNEARRASEDDPD